MTDELPEGWTRCRIEDLFRSFSGGTPSKSNRKYWGGEIPWLSSGDIKTDRINGGSELITQAGLDNSSSKLCRPGSVLVVVRSGILKHTLPVSVLAQKAAINQDIKCFDSGCDDLNTWLALALRASARDILALNREGTTVQSVKYDTLQKFSLPVPPVAEQRRIAEKLATLLAEVEQCKERMAKIPVLLKRFRQSVLAAACSGRLTADWRETHRVNSQDSGDGGDLPSEWRLVAVGDVIDDLRYGTSSKCSPQPNGIAVLRIPNIGNGIIDHSDLKYARLPVKEREKLALVPGDILMIRSNGSVSLVGKTAVVGDREKGFAYAGYLIRLRVKLDAILPRFLHFCFASNDVRQQIEIPARSTSGVNNINSEEVRQLNLLLPPVEEQEEIVQRASKFLALADRIEERYQGAKKQVDGLTQSILAKAFCGELVPAEAELAAQECRDYESADVLLQRVQASKSDGLRSPEHGRRANHK